MYEEQREPKQLRVQGHIPAYCAGTLLRTGPSISTVDNAKTKDGSFKLNHWFDGFSQIHKFTLEVENTTSSDDLEKGVRVTHQSRRQVDELIQKVQETGRMDAITFAQKRDPCDSLFKKLKATFTPYHDSGPGMENMCVTFMPPVHPAMLQGSGHSDKSRVYATTSDHSRIKAFDIDTLEPYGVVDQRQLHSSLDGQLSASHAGHDPATGDIFNYNLKLGPRPTWQIFHTRASDGHTSILAKITGIPASYLHSTFLTQNFFVLCVWPAHFSHGGANVLWTRNIVDAIAPFDKSARTTWVVVDRRHGRGEVARFQSKGFFAFHTVNAFERTSEAGVDIVCDIVEYPSTSIMHMLDYEHVLSTGPHAGALPRCEDASYRLRRYELPLSSDGRGARNGARDALCVASVLPERSVELPTINPRVAMQEHRFVYGLLTRGKATFTDGLGKTDVRTGECVVWERHAHTPGEAIFVPDPNGTAEDEGALLSMVLDGLTGRSYLLCLDARDLSEIGRADVDVPMALGLHGVHLPPRE